MDDLTKKCSQRLIDVVVVTEENVVSLLHLCVVYNEEMAGGSLLFGVSGTVYLLMDCQ